MTADQVIAALHQSANPQAVSVTRCVEISLIKRHMPFKKRSNGVIVNLNLCGVRVL